MPNAILVLNGPNLNLLGTREPTTYGLKPLAEIVNELKALTVASGFDLAHCQSNHEGVLIDRIHQAKEQHVDMIVINPGAFTHTSIAIRDALVGVDIPFIECHLSNVYQREPFRKRSYFSDKAIGTITGFGAHSYTLALQAAIEFLTHNNSHSS